MTLETQIEFLTWLGLANLALLVVVTLWLVWRDVRHDDWENGYKEGRADYSDADQRWVKPPF